MLNIILVRLDCGVGWGEVEGIGEGKGGGTAVGM